MIWYLSYALILLASILGNMVDWWTEEDGKEYEARVEVMVEQANKFEVHGQTVKVGNRQPINEFPSTLIHLRTYSLFPVFIT